MQVWFQVKARNPHLSVCQLGATIGRMWRELTEDEKRKHLEDFHQDKVLSAANDFDTVVETVWPIDNTSVYPAKGPTPRHLRHVCPWRLGSV